MTAPKDRAGLVRLIADWIGSCKPPEARASCIRDADACSCRITAERRLAEAEAAGLRVVPVEATEAMTLQGWLVMPRLRPDTGYIAAAYRTMLAASPFAPQPEDPA